MQKAGVGTACMFFDQIDQLSLFRCCIAVIGELKPGHRRQVRLQGSSYHELVAKVGFSLKVIFN